jgi:phospholipid:diacylglycerol acyltransferase
MMLAGMHGAASAAACLPICSTRWRPRGRSPAKPPQAKGARMVDGDGTVPLVSMGFLAAGPWRTAEFNPAGMRIVIREFQDVKSSNWLGSASSGLLGTRASSAEHVGIMSHGHLLADLRYIMAGRAGELSDNITSCIMQVAARVQH